MTVFFMLLGYGCVKVLVKSTPGVNFINILRENFSYKHCFGSFSLVTCKYFSSYMYVEKAAETTFVRKISTENVDEIDT